MRTGKRVRIHAVVRRVRLSHKRPTFAVRLPRRWNLPFISFRQGREMCFFLILYWCSAIMERCGGANILRGNSRFDEFNPRLGGANSRFGPLREFVYNILIHLTIFAARGRLHGETRQNSRFRREKPRILPHRRNRPRRSLSTIAQITRSEAHTGTAAASWKAVVWISRRWQATWCLGMISRICGSSSEQRRRA